MTLQEPNAGELNRRCTVYDITHEPGNDAETVKNSTEVMSVWCKVEVVGGQVYWDTVGTVDAVTHRIWVRQFKGRTDPVRFSRIKEVAVAGTVYRVKRVTDANGRGVFTLLECEELRKLEETDGSGA